MPIAYGRKNTLVLNVTSTYISLDSLRFSKVNYCKVKHDICLKFFDFLPLWVTVTGYGLSVKEGLGP